MNGTWIQQESKARVVAQVVALIAAAVSIVTVAAAAVQTLRSVQHAAQAVEAHYR